MIIHTIAHAVSIIDCLMIDYQMKIIIIIIFLKYYCNLPEYFGPISGFIFKNSFFPDIKLRNKKKEQNQKEILIKNREKIASWLFDFLVPSHCFFSLANKNCDTAALKPKPYPMTNDHLNKSINGQTRQTNKQTNSEKSPFSMVYFYLMIHSHLINLLFNEK